MPHVTVKLWPGKTERQKLRLAEAISRDVVEILNFGSESVSVSFEEVPSEEWKDRVYLPEIVNGNSRLYKRPGYTM